MEPQNTELKFISFVVIAFLIWDIFSAHGLLILSILVLVFVILEIILLSKKISKLGGVYLVTGYSIPSLLYGAHGVLIYSYRPTLASLHLVMCCIFIGGAVYAQQIIRTPAELSNTAKKTLAAFISITLFIILSVGFYPKVSCSVRGGKYTTGGLIDAEYCLYKYSDGGKPCSSSKECEGACVLLELTSPNNNPVIGVCKSDGDPYGCYDYVEDGKVIGGVCTD